MESQREALESRASAQATEDEGADIGLQGQMADYYPLIAKAAMDLQTAQERRALYERGRNALIDELKAIDPPLCQSIIAREQLAFEDAVRKVEAELARRAQQSG